MIKNYIYYAGILVNDRPSSQPSDGCTSFLTIYASIDAKIAKDICKDFTELYSSLPLYKNNGKCDPNHKNDCKFLNYWLNSKLRENNIYRNVCVNEFYNNMERQCKDIIPVVTSLDYIYDIYEDDLNKMNKLYKLHEQISKIYSILIKDSEEEPNSSLSLSEESLEYYRIFSPMCNGNSREFCKALQDFKDKYKELYSIFQRRGEKYTKYYIELPEVNNNIILTPLLCTVGGLIPLLGILYKVKKL
ncbi:hypothetical protein PVNG_05553 [Plasmodium vivax North Korean]|uniref:PIR Superfamily Protein n=1 Tax=Plasmodium vivax North Korean TaxID=1035514 RepID=A0A0J9U0T1_PLAVI|nr:hypothetical protein PVNG_05553 [Plasmodium vivax North Korean]